MLLRRAVMNAIAFATKRTFHGFLRVTRKALASLGLTAARFDMLSALYGDHDRFENDCQLISQRELRDELGVSASVVSRMVRALEALGLVKRERCLGDRRQFWVALTDEGWECIRRAHRLLLRGVQRIVCDAICFGQSRDPHQRFIHMDALESYLRVLRRDFGDTAWLYYPWGHPDD
jgi:DNA-binding MarR family transcriptional regulator